MICIGRSSGETCSRDVVGNSYSGTLTYATFHARLRDVLRNHHFRIVQDGSCTLSNFLKLKGPVLNNAGVVQSDWPLWSRQIADDIERLRVMLGPVNGEPGLICEPAVVGRAATDRSNNSDVGVDTTCT